MADPTAAQRQMFAKMGLAMPDGSYYIRNGPVGAADLDNAIKAVGRGEDGDPSSGDPIRKHIIKRATALKLTSKIPDTWNPDGSLKHDWTSEVDSYLQHYGVKGMQWRTTAQRNAQIAALSPDKKKTIESELHTAHTLHLAHLAHLKAVAEKSGHKSTAAAAAKLTTAAQKAHAQQLARLTLASNAEGLHPKADAGGSAAHSSADAGLSLEHHGIKGQRWGIRRSRSSTDDHPVSPDAVRARATMDTIKKHGISAVSTEDLQHLVNRQGLEQRHGNLNEEHVSAGKKAVNDFAVQFGKQQASKLAAEAIAKGVPIVAAHLIKAATGTSSGAGRHT